MTHWTIKQLAHTSQHLREVLAETGINICEFARRVGVSRSNAQYWVRGVCVPSTDSLTAIESVLAPLYRPPDLGPGWTLEDALTYLGKLRKEHLNGYRGGVDGMATYCGVARATVDQWLTGINPRLPQLLVLERWAAGSPPLRVEPHLLAHYQDRMGMGDPELAAALGRTLRGLAYLKREPSAITDADLIVIYDLLARHHLRPALPAEMKQ